MAIKRSRLAGVLLAASTIAAGVVTPVATAPAQAAGTYCHARMHPTAAYPNAYGGAWYESHTGWREFSIHVRGIRSLAGKRLVVRVHGTFVGRMRVSQYGRAHLYRRTGLPRMQSGDMVRVRTSWGTLVSYGRLHTMRHHMMMR